MRLLAALAAALFLLLLAPPRTARAQPAAHVTLWHAYRGEEQSALLEVLRLARRELNLEVEALAIPYDAYASKLESAIPHGHGPDVFIDAHERLASFLSRGLVSRVDALLDEPGEPAGRERWEPVALAALSRDGGTYAFPLALKCLALYVNPALVARDPATLEEIEALRASLPRGVYPLAHYAASAYAHAPFAHAHGAALLDDRTGEYLFVGPAAERSVDHVARLLREGVIPEEADGALVSQLFARGAAATAVSGPWLAGELGSRVAYRVVPLPAVAALGGRRLEPLVTVEGAFVSARAHDPALAGRLARFLAGERAAVVRAVAGRQVVATRAAWDDPRLAGDHFLATFRDAARASRPMPAHPHMRSAFEPANQALRKALTGEAPTRVALEEGARRFRDATRPLPAERSPAVALFLVGALGLFVCALGARRARDPDFRRAVRRSAPAYRYVAHAVVAVALLVLAPLVLGAATSLFAGREGRLYYVGLANYWDILSARGGPLLASGSFYLVLCVTVLWTLANITLHVALGVSLALLLSRPKLKLRGLYRVLLIIPWAVPSYVTALAWKGMFHRQMGAINAVLVALGAPPVAWFARFSTAFAANVATNVWLGFPFMMVVTLGALAAIPRDLYEAAAVDGATAWQRFWKITAPLLRPSLGPAVAMGAVWTFNMFNVIFLVSGGQPDGQTEILVTEAYRWAFTRQAQYGYAAAYAVLIFGILALGTRALDRAVKANPPR